MLEQLLKVESKKVVDRLRQGHDEMNFTNLQDFHGAIVYTVDFGLSSKTGRRLNFGQFKPEKIEL